MLPPQSRFPISTKFPLKIKYPFPLHPFHSTKSQTPRAPPPAIRCTYDEPSSGFCPHVPSPWCSATAPHSHPITSVHVIARTTKNNSRAPLDMPHHLLTTHWDTLSISFRFYINKYLNFRIQVLLSIINYETSQLQHMIK